MWCALQRVAKTASKRNVGGWRNFFVRGTTSAYDRSLVWFNPFRCFHLRKCVVDFLFPVASFPRLLFFSDLFLSCFLSSLFSLVYMVTHRLGNPEVKWSPTWITESCTITLPLYRYWCSLTSVEWIPTWMQQTIFCFPLNPLPLFLQKHRYRGKNCLKHLKFPGYELHHNFKLVCPKCSPRYMCICSEVFLFYQTPCSRTSRVRYPCYIFPLRSLKNVSCL